MSTHREAEVEVVKDDLRCRRSDGRGWRCGAPAMSGRTRCEKHFKRNQGRERKKKGEKSTKKMKSLEAVSGFAQGNPDLFGSSLKPEAKDGNAGCQNEQESLETNFNEISGRCKSAFVISGHNVEAEAAEVDIVARLKSLTRMTLALLLQNLTRDDFIRDIVTLKVQCEDDPGATWKVFECNPYILGEAENPDMYISFLNYLCKLAEEDHNVVEKWSTGEGDRIEYLFRSFSPNEVGTREVFEPDEGFYIMGYSRQLPSPKQWAGMRVYVHLTMSQFLKGEEHLSVLKGAALPIAQLLPTDQSGIT
ncbi:uncharacterized protein LOC131050148 isoform X2 [Cryptomeria japonica]|uniref:uncharacterized protein LOC131050148 isoform X2 n=1 Tax=Cryptomeria japonica TaxID=3369 RepID=UPI0025AD5ED7|nr:uncharacterized protein LOC131050148 isoform X2 [Cryptomeria japonica]